MQLICEPNSLDPVSQHSDASVAIEIQLSEPVFRQLQQALDRYAGHNADSLCSAAIVNYLAMLEVLETSGQQEQFQSLVKLLESCFLSHLAAEQSFSPLLCPDAID